MFKIAEKDHRNSNPGWNPGSVPSSNPGLNPGSDPGSNPGSDPGFILSLSRKFTEQQRLNYVKRKANSQYRIDMT